MPHPLVLQVTRKSLGSRVMLERLIASENAVKIVRLWRGLNQSELAVHQT